MKPFFKQEMKQRLKECDNLQEAFDILSEYYETENCRPGFITKNVLVGKLEDAVTSLKAQPRKQYR